jgi:hypothetical protein
MVNRICRPQTAAVLFVMDPAQRVGRFTTCYNISFTQGCTNVGRRVARCEKIFSYAGALCFWILGVKLGSCNHYGA